MTEIKTVFSDGFEILPSDNEFTYQEKLTDELDKPLGDFDDNIINKIVLWKVDRYALLSPECLEKINLIDPASKVLDVELTKEVLKLLLSTNGIRLPMASTILRFKNKNIYQIIDQRVYRIIYKKNFPIVAQKSEAQIDAQIDIYLIYLKDLRAACERHNIDFSNSDRILYMADKRLNKAHKIAGR